jgi:hypothetical protein
MADIAHPVAAADRPSTLRRVQPLVAALVVATASLLALSAGVARADFNIGYYTHDTCTNWNLESTRVDPINYVFFVWGTIDRVHNQVLTHGYGHGYNWNNRDGSPQKFISHSTCYPQDSQHADHPETSGRSHFREKAMHWDSTLGYTEIADAHHENIVWCGYIFKHAVDSGTGSDSGFNKGRANVTNEVFANTAHMTGSYQIYFGNTQPMRQCDGKYAASDGYARMMTIHQINH